MMSSHLKQLRSTALQTSMFFLFLSIAASTTFAQQSAVYVDFKPADSSKSMLKMATEKKVVTILTSGGYVNIKLTAAFKSTKGLAYYAYYKGKRKGSSNQFNGPIYLNPGNAYLIDVMDLSTDTLVRQYHLLRPKLLPKIELYRENKELFHATKTDRSANEFVLSPADRIALKVAPRTDFPNMEVEYTLLNLKTKRSQYGIASATFKNLVFEANTAYQLRYSYVAQQESVAIIYIRVKPYWYQSSVTYILLALAVVMIGVFLLISVLKKKINTAQKEQQKMEQAAIRLQSLLNPHFTFNALSAIQGLMNTNRIDEANLYLQEFSALLRQSLAKSQEVYTTLDQELEMMRLYIKLEAFRFNFAWEIEIAPTLNPSVLEIPTLLLQPLVENAIKHGLSKLGAQGKLQLICSAGQKKDTFVIMVKDNGSWIAQTGSGYGLALTKERIATINKMKKSEHITLDFDQQSGTTAILTFHHWIED
jgi:two-component system LytT family sensor kinase